ncbi:TonB-dependent receptor [Sphingomonas colocasiae]|uniref:TonB-dependent receptor n=1 Tax=Sphingomonas colocasiae TaxID=1848973 RepID=A0ABS7PI89_9SPHN|nr:TonB-dependent receptor [Sphingomonas colocasiae]MBY8821022.1 TonB-dependent receptor [Sphingomonas colocasiae]
MTKTALLVSVGLSVLVPAQAFAQSAEATVDAAAAPEDQAMSDGEIVVTAQRRSESLQNVPISITALTADQLASAGVASTQDLTLATPGLLWAKSSNNSQPTIRGIGSRNASAGDEPNVATFIDGVYQPEQATTAQELSNVERIEVLKGPQGTLFGRNATGGAINIVTKKPSFETTGDASLTYGRYDFMKATAYLSGPIVTDKLAASFAATGLRDDGYIHNIYLDTQQGVRKAAIIRAKLLFVPSDTVEIQLNGLYNYSWDNVTYSGQPLNGNSQARRATAAQNPLNLPIDVRVPTKPYTTSEATVPFFRLNQYLVDGHVSIDLGGAVLAGLASWSETHGFSHSVTDISPLSLSINDFRQRGRAYNQEITLTSDNDGRLSWLIGATGFQSRTLYDPLTSISPTTTTRLVYGQKSKAIAGFAEATYEAIDDLFLTAGIRYSWDQKQSYNQPLATNVVTQGKQSWKDWSPRAVIRYEFGRGSNVYASYTQGYKAGTFNATTVNGTLIPANPERIEAFEVGVKTQPAPGITVNAAAFHYNYTDLQVSLVTTVNNQIATLLQNAPKAEVDGFEMDVSARVTEGLRLNAGLSLLRPKIVDFVNASVNVPVLVGGLPAGNSTVGPVDVSGNDLIRAPRWTLNIGANYDTAFAGGVLTFNASAFFSGRYFVELTNRVKQPAYEVVNASVAWRSPDTHWRLSVFGQNLTNQKYYAGAIITNFADNVSYQKPRWFGVSAGYSF